MKRYKSVIFDFNGTLVFDTANHDRAWKIITSKYREKPFSDEELEKNIHGRTNKAIFEYITGRELNAAEVDKFSTEKELIYQKLCREDKNFRLIRGAEDFLNYLRDNKIPRTIATASNRMNVDFYVEMLHLERWFDLDKIVYDDGTLEGKPSPDIYEKAAKILQTKPEDCIVFEDAILGIESASRAGIGKIIAVVGDKSKQLSGEEKFGVKERIENFSDFERNKLLFDI
ncbi:MAG TPA: HAD family phosphatase [Candidatus Adamsella sp.]|nr:HAD family phosphatase [Candidatus Adamsella sp.]